ncbi:MAG: hypothetical protein HY286_12920 [Planctomycetes bacterium]|nr:hypothetical protein [Planctomycetota bacterium]
MTFPDRCPKCSSESIQKLSIVYMSGKSARRGDFLGLSVGSGIEGVEIIPFVGSSSGVDTTFLAEMAAPPARMSIFDARLMWLATLVPVVPLLAFAFEIMIKLPILIIICCGAICILLFAAYHWRRVSDFNAHEWPELRRQWENEWFCHRCGVIFKKKENPTS